LQSEIIEDKTQKENKTIEELFLDNKKLSYEIYINLTKIIKNYSIEKRLNPIRDIIKKIKEITESSNILKDYIQKDLNNGNNTNIKLAYSYLRSIIIDTTYLDNIYKILYNTDPVHFII